MEYTFEYPAALVTGGGSGLGRVLALRLAGAGLRVSICGRRAEPLQETERLATEAGGDVRGYECDITDPQAVAAMFDDIGGCPPLLVNNAAGAFVAPADEISPNGWRSVVDVSLNGTFYVAREWQRRLSSTEGGGVLLNISSATVPNGSPGTAHSGAAKSGVESLTKTLATEWARFGIRINALAPGAFETPGAADHIWTDSTIRDRVENRIPLGRIADVDEIADVALFMLSKGARYMTGSIIKVDGGWTLTPWLYIDPENRSTSQSGKS